MLYKKRDNLLGNLQTSKIPKRLSPLVSTQFSAVMRTNATLKMDKREAVTEPLSLSQQMIPPVDENSYSVNPSSPAGPLRLPLPQVERRARFRFPKFPNTPFQLSR